MSLEMKNEMKNKTLTESNILLKGSKNITPSRNLGIF